MEGIPPGPPMLVHPYVMLTDEERQAAQAAAAAAAADETRDDMDHGQQQARQDDPGSNQSRVNYFGEGFSSRSATDGARRGWATDVSSDTAKLEPPPEPYPQIFESDEPDYLVYQYPIVEDDSKPALADHQFVSPQATVLQAPTPYDYDF